MKVILPSIPPGVKKRYDVIGEQVNPCEVWPLSQITTMASQSQVYGFAGTSVLFGHNVFQVKSKVAVLLPEETVFTAIPGPSSNQAPRLRTGHRRGFEVSRRRALSLRMAMKSAAVISAS